jgi:chromosome segregation ATPase
MPPRQQSAKSAEPKPSMQLCFLHDSLQRFSIASPEPTDMLDALKNLTGGKNKLVQKQTDELELLVTSAREERAAISAMLTTLTTRSQKLAPLSRTLEQTTERVTGVTERLDDIAARVALIDDRTKALEEVDLRIQALKDAADQAEQTTHKALGPDGELQQLRKRCINCRRRHSRRTPRSRR